MDLSIIIINWNTKNLLNDCLVSVFRNAPSCHHEIIVVDNASSDGSQELVRAKFPTVTLIANHKNLGFAAANNIAIRKSSGRNILLLNSDTLVHGNVLQKSHTYLGLNPAVGFMGCRVLNSDGTLQHSTSQFPSFTNLMIQTFGLDRLSFVPFLQRYQMKNWKRTEEKDVETVSGCYLMLKRTCLNSIGLLDDNFFFFGEETDWCLRARKAGWKVRFAPVGEITHFGGGSSGSLNHKRDLMLTEATIRLHMKHRGLYSAALIFMLLFTFNISRSAFWLARSILQRNHRAQKRSNHFINIIGNFTSTWPHSKGEVS